MGEKEKKGLNRKALIAIIIVLLCVVGGVTAFAINSYIHKENNVQEGSDLLTSGSGMVVTEDNRDDVSKSLGQKANSGSLVVRMTQGWVFTDGCTKSNAYLGNSVRNEAPVRFVITMEDTGEVLMTSPEVPVGSCIENFPLSVKLEAGTYKVIVTHQLMRDGEPYGNVNTAATITVR